MEQIKQVVALASNLEAGTIRIGSFSSASACILPKIIAKFQKKHPNITFTFFEGTYEEIMEWFETGVIDIGVIVQNTNMSVNVLPLIQDRMVVAYPEGHRFHYIETIELNDLQQEPFIMPKGDYLVHVDEI